MTTTVNLNMPSMAQMAKPRPVPRPSPLSEIHSKSAPQTTRLPGTSECATHLHLLNAIVRLKMVVDDWGLKKGMPEGQAWDQFCRIATTKFLEWSENVDTTGQTIPVPPLDVLMVWHSFMLNPKDYMIYADRVLRGRFGGKGIDWQQLVSQDDLSLDIFCLDI